MFCDGLTSGAQVTKSYAKKTLRFCHIMENGPVKDNWGVDAGGFQIDAARWKSRSWHLKTQFSCVRSFFSGLFIAMVLQWLISENTLPWSRCNVSVAVFTCFFFLFWSVSGSSKSKWLLQNHPPERPVVPGRFRYAVRTIRTEIGTTDSWNTCGALRSGDASCIFNIGCEYSPAFGEKKEKAQEDKVKVSNLWLLLLIQAQPCSTNSNARFGQLKFVCG